MKSSLGNSTSFTSMLSERDVHFSSNNVKHLIIIDRLMLILDVDNKTVCSSSNPMFGLVVLEKPMVFVSIEI